MRTMSRAKALQVKPGDVVALDPLYNRSERQPNRILTPTTAVAIREDRGCQSGVLITVRTQSGRIVDLDAGWFKA